MFSDALKLALKSSQSIKLNEVMEYAVLPAGKLFRPLLTQSLAHDLQTSSHSNITHLGCAIELHHSYTLVHDDLPAMDNDLMRRGKPSTHAKFGEWKAILAGDALLVQSFHELNKIDHVHFKKILNLFTWATGHKGLIAGQYLDLEDLCKNSIQEILRIHELKTARLLQVATLGSYLLSTQEIKQKEVITYMRLGQIIGLIFQLLDDLDDLPEETLSTHEKEINPFYLAPSAALDQLTRHFNQLKKMMKDYNLPHLAQMLEVHFKQNQTQLLKKDFLLIEKNVRNGLRNFLTSFV